MEISNLTKLFQLYQEQSVPPIVELQNKEHEVVGALYLDKMTGNKIVISETNNSEKYMLFVDGIAIYFSYYRQIKL